MRPTVYGKWVRSVYGTYAAAVVIALALNLPWMLGVPNLFGMISAMKLLRGWAILGAAVVLGVPLVVYAAATGMPQRKRLRSAAESAETLCCPWCLYDLKGASPVGACPECGVQYTLDGVRGYWPGILHRLDRAKRTGLPARDRRLLEECGWR